MTVDKEKCHLTDLQYNGGPGMTPADHSCASEIITSKCRTFALGSRVSKPGPIG